MKLDWSQLKRPIVALSPMADMTDSAFCRIVRDVSAQGQQPDASSQMPPTIMFREMVSAEAVVRGNEKTLGMTDIHPAERPLVQQIFGSDPKTMAEAARIIEKEHHPEGFDINMGCPVYKLVHNFNGAALMKDPVLATEIIKAVKAAITVPLSVKIRAGWSDPKECWDFIKVLEDAGADLVTIHGRTKVQGYSGRADWNTIAEAKKRVRIPVLANGDIHDAAMVPDALNTSGCDGVLIARGALGNPWFFRQAEEALAGKTPTPISAEERIRVVKQHARLHVEQYGERGITTFRKHLSWYFKGLRGAKLFREKLVRVSTLADLDAVLDEMLANGFDGKEEAPRAASLPSITCAD